jgi:hypothetical protein
MRGDLSSSPDPHPSQPCRSSPAMADLEANRPRVRCPRRSPSRTLAGARLLWRSSWPTRPAPALAGDRRDGPCRSSWPIERPRACPGLRSPCRAPPWPISAALLELLADPSRTRLGRRSPSGVLPEIVAGGRQAGRCRISWL